MKGRSVAVVGGGVIGLCSAWFLSEAGFAVTVVERGAEDHDGCSQGNAGLVCPSHVVPLAAPGMLSLGLKWLLDSRSPFYVKPRLSPGLWRWGRLFMGASTEARVAAAAPLLRDLNLLSRALYEDFAARDEFGFRRHGLLMLCETPEGLHDETRAAERARALGLQVELLSAGGAAALNPELPARVAGGVLYAQDCHLHPASFLAALTRRLRERGVAFRFGADITGWANDGRRVVAARSARGEIAADEFVIAGGAWTPPLARPLGLRVPIEAGKGYSLTVPRPQHNLALPVILHEARVAMTPMGDALRVGGTMELAGLDESVSARRVEGIVAAATRVFPGLPAADFAAVPAWRGLRPCSPDGLPYIGRVSRFDNLSLAAGHAMLGLSLGPATGKLIAQCLTGAPPSIPLAALSPDRHL